VVAADHVPGGDSMERRTHHSVYELLQQERYTPEEVAELLGIGVHIVQHAVFSGELRAQIVGHDIISLQRDDVLAWLEARDGVNQAGPTVAHG
jgi:excisionase family DNA binding protein